MAKIAAKTALPAIEKRTVAMPVRPKNADVRTREYLTDDEMQRLGEAAKANRHGHRDATMILVAYRHGLRASELTDLRWDQVEFTTATLHVRRVKPGTPSTHPIWATNYARLEGFNASRSLSRHSCLRRNVARHSPRRDSHQ